MSISVNEAYSLLNVTARSSDDEITKSFKQLAMRYHPDKNRNRIEWANGIMAKINSAYSVVMEERFKKNSVDIDNPEKKSQEKATKDKEKDEEFIRQFAEDLIREQQIKAFLDCRETAKDGLYKYFQYSLYNFTIRDKSLNNTVFNDIVKMLKKNYHRIGELAKLTKDNELIAHFTVFNDMIFNFYKASECLNILDSYKSIIDIEAYRIYHKGDDFLHNSHKEIFYDRHNRGTFHKEDSIEFALTAKNLFSETIRSFPNSSWVIESQIKLNYAISLLRYIDLFFNEDE